MTSKGILKSAFLLLYAVWSGYQQIIVTALNFRCVKETERVWSYDQSRYSFSLVCRQWRGNWQNPLTNCYGSRWHSRHSNWSPSLYSIQPHLCPILLCPILPIARQPLLGQSIFIIEASRSHSGTPLSVGLVQMGDKRKAETSTWQLKLTNIHSPGGIRTRNPSNRAAAEPRLRPRRHWFRQLCPFTFCNYKCFNVDLLPISRVTKRNEFLHADSGLFLHSVK